MSGASGSQRRSVLSLYRNILRVGRSWDGGAEEKNYIFEEARSKFRENRSIIDSDRIAELIREGETRLEYAVHYRIPYPRLQHETQFPRRYFMDAPKSEPAGAGRPPQGSTAKLQQAAERLRAKQKERQQD